MPIRTTVDIPEPVHGRLRNLAETSGSSIRSLIVRAIQQSYPDTNNSGGYLTHPLIPSSG